MAKGGVQRVLEKYAYTIYLWQSYINFIGMVCGCARSIQRRHHASFHYTDKPKNKKTSEMQHMMKRSVKYCKCLCPDYLATYRIGDLLDGKGLHDTDLMACSRLG